MELLGFFLYFGFNSPKIELQNISFSENIEYCTNIMYDPSLEQEFYKNCDISEVNEYIMLVKNHFN